MEDQEKLNELRHSAAHLLAAAVKDLWPEAKPTIGPAIENGFYYDFGDLNISETDFPKIEKRMKKLATNWKEFTHEEVSADQAKETYKDNPFKQELVDEIVEKGEKITLYTSGEFTDLCRGGHVDEPNKALKHFKLLSVAGAYWRGDENNQMLTRVYGTAFFSEEKLDDYLEMLEEAKKRDHKKLGKELGLFAFSDLVGPGLPMFTAKGTIIKDQLENFVRKEKENLGYKFVSIPHIARASLYEKSGHLGKYDAMMPTMKDKDGDEFVIKAMNCPHHFELFKAEPHSYRDLPLRMAGTTEVYRNEKSGELSGLVRVASITQDDTHHFVKHNQISAEIEMIIGLMQSVYEVFGFSDFEVHISVRDPKNKEKYFGDDKLWHDAEATLEEAVKKWGVPYTVDEGEAAFYGPKIDVTVKDSLGRKWQLTTVQLDFNQPENFDLEYTDENGEKQRPAILHVAILGSVERFMGILIEHYAGNFPLWLSPVQVKVLPISASQHDYASQIAQELEADGIRVEADLRDTTIGKKIREAETGKIPVMLVVGDKEKDANEVAVRTKEDGDHGSKPLAEVKQELLQKISNRE